MTFISVFARYFGLDENLFSKYFLNTGWFLSARVIQLVLSAATAFLVARYLGPQDYGQFCFSVAFVALFLPLTLLAHDSIVVRELVENPSNTDTILGTAFVIRFICSLLILLLLALIVSVAIKTDRIFILILAVTPFAQCFNVIDLFFQSRVDTRWSFLPQALQTLSTLTIRLYLIWIHAHVYWFIIATVIDLFVIVCGYIFSYYKYGLIFKRWRFDSKLAVGFLKGSFFLFLASLSYSIFLRMDLVFVKMFFGPKILGNYSLVNTMLDMWGILPSIICASLFPAIILTKDLGKEMYEERIKKLIRFLGFLGVIAGIVNSLLISFVVSPLMGIKYDLVSPIGNLFSISLVPYFISYALIKLMVAQNQLKKVFIMEFLGALIYVIFAFIFSLKKIFIGLVIAKVLSIFIMYYFAFYITDRSIFNLITQSIFNPTGTLKERARR